VSGFFQISFSFYGLEVFMTEGFIAECTPQKHDVAEFFNKRNLARHEEHPAFINFFPSSAPDGLN
jgi:hypothetical protein